MSSEHLDAFVSLHQFVLSVINAKRETNLNNYDAYLQFAIEGITEEIYPYLAPAIEVVYKTVPESKVVALPPDLQYYTKVGIVVNGNVWTLTLNEDMAPARTYADSDLCETTPEIAASTTATENFGVIPFAPHYNGGVLVETMYGMGGGFNRAYYKVDMIRRTLTLQGNVSGDEIVIEYVSTGVKANGLTYLNRLSLPALRAYVLARIVDNDDRIPANEKQRRWFMYESEVEKLAYKQMAFTMDEYLDTVYRTYSQTPKR